MNYGVSEYKYMASLLYSCQNSGVSSSSKFGSYRVLGCSLNRVISTRKAKLKDLFAE